mgnify:CR=1 FL=1
MITKDIVIAAIVRAFFKYYVTGLLETQTDVDISERFEPKNVKRIMLDHYEKISHYFNTEAFYAISRINYEHAEIESLLKDFVTPETTEMDLVRFACRTEEMYKVMVEEYKRNFTNLLAGHIETLDEHVESYTRNTRLGEIDIDKAEKIINRIATKAYELGKS